MDLTVFFGHSRDVAMATHFMAKMGEIGPDSYLCVTLAFRNGLEYHILVSEGYVDDLTRWCKNLVNVGPATPDFKRGQNVA